MAQAHILVIKHGALGDIILATGPLKAIRQHHLDAHITLLTSPPYASLLKSSGLFDEVWIDSRPKWWQWRKWRALIHQLRSRAFTRVYDLQTSSRSSSYFKLLSPTPEWSGIAEGSSHRHNTPHRTVSHTIDRQKEQLAIAGITQVPAPDISWLSADITRFSLPRYYALFVPGGSAHRPEKRWPVEHYAALAQHCAAKGVVPILIGTEVERPLLEHIAQACPSAINLCQNTNFAEIVSLARGAAFAVGNDTGPMHIIAATGCASSVLFSHASNPDLCAPRGVHVRILRKASLTELSVQDVWDSFPLPTLAY